MVFSSAVFLVAFLPLTLAAYFAGPPRLRNALLLAASLFFYAWGEKQYVWVLALSAAGNYAAGLWIARAPHARGRLAVAVTANLLPLAVFKYAKFFADNLAAL